MGESGEERSSLLKDDWIMVSLRRCSDGLPAGREIRMNWRASWLPLFLWGSIFWERGMQF